MKIGLQGLYGELPEPIKGPATCESFAQRVNKHDRGPHCIFSSPTASIPIPQINTFNSPLIKLFSIS